MPESKCKHVVAILIDNTSGEKFLEFLNQGLFPNLKKYVLDRGSFCQHSICKFPSSSANGHTTLATGLFQSKSGVLNAAWWDTAGKVPVPYKVDSINVSTIYLWDKIIKAKTMFEWIPNKDSASFHTIKRGAGFKFFQMRTLIKYIGVFLKMKFGGVEAVTSKKGVFETLILNVFKKYVKDLQAKKKFPMLTFLLFLPTDDKAHKFGHDSEEYKEAISLVEYLVGALVDGFDEKGRHVPGIKELGYFDSTAIVLFADHSSKPFGRENTVDMVTKLKVDFPWKCYSSPILDNTFESFKKEKGAHWDALTYEGGEHIPLYLPAGNGHARRSISVEDLQTYRTGGVAVNFKDYFFSVDAVIRLYHPIDSDTILVHSRDGIAQMTQLRGGDANVRQYKYELLEGADPLNYIDDAPELADGQFHSHLEWLRGTYLATYPNVPEHMFGFFNNENAPTLIVTAKSGWVFTHPEDPEDHTAIYVNQHDGEYRYEVSTPLIFGGAGVKQGVEIDVCQNVDMLPTMLKLLGIKFAPGDFHGRALDEFLDAE